MTSLRANRFGRERRPEDAELELDAFGTSGGGLKAGPTWLSGKGGAEERRPTWYWW